jgi:hypothetical protein
MGFSVTIVTVLTFAAKAPLALRVGLAEKKIKLPVTRATPEKPVLRVL